MNTLKKIPFFLPLLALFFCLHGGAENFGAVPAKEVAVTGLSVLVCLIILFGLVFVFTRNILFAGLIAVFIGTWFFFFGAIHDFVKSIHVLTPIYRYTVFLPLLCVATLAWIFFLKRKKQVWPKLALFLNILLIIYCLVDLGRIGYKAVTTGTPKQGFSFDYAAVSKKPDVFLILMDGYPGQKALEDSFGFSNEDMMNFLAADSFRVLPGSSNYNITQFSMASLLNMDYIRKGFDPNSIAQVNILQRAVEINNGAVFHIFSGMGYHVENNSVFDVLDQPGTFDASGFLLGHNFLLTDKILPNRMNRDLGGGALSAKWLKWIPFLKDQTYEGHKNDNNKMAEKLERIAIRPAGAPVFCYTHFLMPHGPYFFDSVGRPTPPEVYSAPLSWMNRDNFISYLKYSNGVAKKMIMTIREKRPGAIIIFMSDHGFREYLNDESVQPVHYNNICAVYFPEKPAEPAPSFLTNVNFFRYLFNAQFNQRLPYLLDSTIALKFKL